MEKIVEQHKRVMETDESIKAPSQPKAKKVKTESVPVEDVDADLAEPNAKKLEAFVALPRNVCQLRQTIQRHLYARLCMHGRLAPVQCIRFE